MKLFSRIIILSFLVLSACSTSVQTPSNSSDQKQGLDSENYINFDASKVSRASEGRVILFFYASWCPICNRLNTSLNANLDRIPTDLTIMKVRYDDLTGASEEELALKSKYGITYQATLVQIDENGNIIKKWSNSDNLDELLREVQ